LPYFGVATTNGALGSASIVAFCQNPPPHAGGFCASGTLFAGLAPPREVSAALLGPPNCCPTPTRHLFVFGAVPCRSRADANPMNALSARRAWRPSSREMRHPCPGTLCQTIELRIHGGQMGREQRPASQSWARKLQRAVGRHVRSQLGRRVTLAGWWEEGQLVDVVGQSRHERESL
jgi:hypothetical protein